MQGRRKLNLTLMATVAALTGVFALSAVKPAEAQRKSIRWATSSVDSYGYQVAASMTKMIEEALGGEYTVTVNPYPQTTSAGKAAMDGNAEVGYTADIGMREIYDGTAGFRNYTAAKGKLVHTWYAYPMKSFMATTVARADKMKCLKDFSGQPVFFTPAGFMNWLNFQRMFKIARLRLQARADRSEDAVGCAAGRHHRGLGRLHGLRCIARAVLEGNRNPDGPARRQSVPG